MAEQDNAGTGGAPVRPNADRAAQREQVLADLDRIAAGGKPAEAASKPAEAPATEAEEKPAEDESAQHEAADEHPEADAADEHQDEDTSKDPDLAKRLAIVAKHEERAKRALAARKAEIEAERAAVRREREAIEREIQSVRTEIEAFSKLKERAKYDPTGVLKSLGLRDEDLGPAARALAQHDPAFKERNPEAAAAMMQRREQEDRIAKLERELAEERKTREEHAARERVASKVESYLTGITKAIKDEHPLAKRLVEKAPDKARVRFAAIANELAERDDGDLPDAEDVLAEYERRRRIELEEDGVDVATMFKVRAAKPSNGETRTLGSDIGTTTAPKASGPRKSPAEKRAELEAELRAMDLKSR